MIEKLEPIPVGLADRIEIYLDDTPHGGGHSDRAGANAWELLQEAMDELRAPAQCRLSAFAEELRVAYRAEHDNLGAMQADTSIDAVSRNWQGGKVRGLGDARMILQKYTALTSTPSHPTENIEPGA